MNTPVTAYIGLGANLGAPALAVLAAMEAIADIDGVALMRKSSLYSSAPVDAAGDDYINAVVEVQTRLAASDLLTQLQAIELRAGRERPYRNAPRTLDLDLLLYGDVQLSTPALTVPHPRMWERAFVLRPLSEIAAHLVSDVALQSVASQRLGIYPTSPQ